MRLKPATWLKQGSSPRGFPHSLRKETHSLETASHRLCVIQVEKTEGREATVSKATHSHPAPTQKPCVESDAVLGSSSEQERMF